MMIDTYIYNISFCFCTKVANLDIFYSRYKNELPKLMYENNFKTTAQNLIINLSTRNF